MTILAISVTFSIFLFGFLTLHVAASNLQDPAPESSTAQASIFAPSTSLKVGTALTIISYFPIAFYAEDLRLQSALLSVICNPFSIPLSITGSVKDFHRLWNLDQVDIFDGFEERILPVVSSLRNGNNFPLVNQAILDLLGITRTRSKNTRNNLAPRLTTVAVSYIIPQPERRKNMGVWMNRIRMTWGIILLEVVILIWLLLLLVRKDLYIAVGLLGCIIASTLTLSMFRHCLNVHFAYGHRIEADNIIRASSGASLDVHVIVRHWNASKMEVVVGYSTQLHSLTNVSARILNHHGIMKWGGRFLAIVLAAQAALLASLISNSSDQVWGSAIWLVVHATMHLPPKLMERVLNPSEAILGAGHSFGTNLKHVPPLAFSGRRAALAFISTLPHTRRSARWDWLDGFIPRNDRRREWEIEIENLMLNPDEPVRPQSSSEERETMGKWGVVLRNEVKQARATPQFVAVEEEYRKAVGL